ncbi:DEAD/DEAH box helicase family protein [Millionella massiliensis]|uniref:DEAD/DEAH box helicase family protein n=1 Tax=Millionella massiliensis TaxID=1871023 RepID=UPI0023A8563C|nr:DEAD/DEAH box helicase family protein [Millionella massiliensis]
MDQTHTYFQLDPDTGRPVHSRGKLIMACGTGKTFTSLRIAENETGGRGLILFLVPIDCPAGSDTTVLDAAGSEAPDGNLYLF